MNLQPQSMTRNASLCPDCCEGRQLELIQRLSRTGYWEYDIASGRIDLPVASSTLLALIVGAKCAEDFSFDDVLPDAERKRLQNAIAQAVAEQLPLQCELKLPLAQVGAGEGESHAYLAVRGEPLNSGDAAAARTVIRFVGSFHDITREKRVEAERETVISQLHSLLSSLPLGVTAFDEDLRLIFWNEPIYSILGLPQGAVYRYARFEDLIRYPAERGEYGPGDPAQLVQERAERARRFEPHRFERTGADGRTLLVEGYPMRFGGKTTGFVTIYTDVTERKMTEEQLTRQNNVLTTIIENFPGAISLFDADLHMVARNQQFGSLLGLPESLLSRPDLNFEDLIRYNAERGEYGPGDIASQVATIVARARDFQPHKLERIRPDGQALEVRGMPLPGGGFVSIYIDITERKRNEERIRVMALHDGLTGLPNRLNLNDHIEQALERGAASGQHFALLFLDLDGFKSINDTLGHDAGDELLVAVAAQLKLAVRETDLIARLGGDEFVVLLHDTGGSSIATEIAADIVACLAVPFTLKQGEARIGTSIGIALYPQHGATREALLQAADAAMYAAKAGGRRTWRLAGETL